MTGIIVIITVKKIKAAYSDFFFLCNILLFERVANYLFSLLRLQI